MTRTRKQYAIAIANAVATVGAAIPTGGLATLLPAAVTLYADSLVGTKVWTPINKTAGSTIMFSPNDGRIAVDGNGNLVVGLTASAPGATINGTVTETLGGVTLASPIAISISAMAPWTYNPNVYRFASSSFIPSFYQARTTTNITMSAAYAGTTTTTATITDGTTTTTGTLTNGSAVITGALAALTVGATITSTTAGIPAGTTIASRADQNYFIREKRISTGPYDITDPRFFFEGYWSANAGAAAEAPLANPWYVDGISISLEGSNSWTVLTSTTLTVPIGTVAVPGAVSPAGNNATMTANSIYHVRFAGHTANVGDYLPANTFAMSSAQAGGSAYADKQLTGGASMVASLTTASALAGSTSYIGGYMIAPAFMVGKGGDGRPVFWVTGDSNGTGVGDEAGVTNRCMYGVYRKGFDDSASGRITVHNDSVPGSRESAKVAGAADMKMASYTMFGGVTFTHALLQDGVNDLLRNPNVQTALPTWYDYVATKFPSVKLYTSQMSPHTTASTDMVTSYANQNQVADESYPNGDLWAANALAVTTRFNGRIVGSVALWPNLVAGVDTIDNHSRWVITPFAAAGGTLASAAAAKATSVVVTATVAPEIGSFLVFAPTTAPVHTSGPIDSVVDNKDGTFTVGFSTGGVSGAYAAGTLVKTTNTGDGVHWSTRAVALALPTFTAWKAATFPQSGWATVQAA